MLVFCDVKWNSDENETQCSIKMGTARCKHLHIVFQQMQFVTEVHHQNLEGRKLDLYSIVFFLNMILGCLVFFLVLTCNSHLNRLVDIAPHYYDLTNFPQCEAKRVLEKLYKKREKEKEESRSRR